MKIKEIMCTDFKVISPETSLRRAAEIMRDCDIGYLPIGENDRLVGAVTDRDIVIRGIAAGRDPITTSVQRIMTGKVVYCFESDDVRAAGEYMKEKQIRRLVVLSRAKRMVGVVTLGDIARACNDDKLTGDIETGVAQAA